MIKINKKTPPIELLELKNAAMANNLSANEAYNTLSKPINKSIKEKVRQMLISEQGHLCAYCMRKIPDERVTDETNPGIYIEHWSARNAPDGSDAEGALNYNNMLVVCSGNQYDKTANGKSRLTCDAKRGNRPLKVNPLNDTRPSEMIAFLNGRSVASSKVGIGVFLSISSQLLTMPFTRKTELSSIDINTDPFFKCRSMINLPVMHPFQLLSISMCSSGRSDRSR